MVRGGKRENAGRPKGSNKWKESTKVVRLPESMVGEVYAYLESRAGYKLPLYGAKVEAGFPSPADDYMEGKLDLNQHLIHHPTATFFVRVSGESMLNAGMFPNDLLIVDRSIEPVHGKIVIAVLDGELTVKRLYMQNGVIKLMPENEKFQPIEIEKESELTIWGVVTNVIHAV